MYLVDYQDFYLREFLLYLLDRLDAGHGDDIGIEFPAPQPSEVLEAPLGQFGVVLLSQTDPVLKDECRRVRGESLEYAEHDEGLARARRGVDDSATVLYGLVYEFDLVVVEGYPVHALGKPRVEETVVYLVVPEIDLRPVVPHLGVYLEVFHRRLDLRKKPREESPGFLFEELGVPVPQFLLVEPAVEIVALTKTKAIPESVLEFSVGRYELAEIVFYYEYRVFFHVFSLERNYL